MCLGKGPLTVAWGDSIKIRISPFSVTAPIDAGSATHLLRIVEVIIVEISANLSMTTHLRSVTCQESLCLQPLSVPGERS